jgi:hypothetical protein
MFLELLIYALTGAVAGILAGLLGIGGGLVIVPVLTSVFLVFLDTEYVVHLAIATSLATILITGLSSVRTHHAHGAVRWDVFTKMVSGILLGGFLGAWLSQYVASFWLAKIFGLMELLIAIQMIWGRQPNPQRQLPGLVSLNSVSGGIGSLSALLGVGGGALTTPYLIWNNIKIHQAIATSAAFGLPVALSGTVGYMLAGYGLDGLPEYTSGFVYWPAFISIVAVSIFTANWGAKLAHNLPIKTLKRAFGVLLIGLGLKMLFLG